MKLFANVMEAEKALSELGDQLGHEQISRAVRMAINDTMRKERTAIRQVVRQEYNIPSDKINSIDFSKATDYNLESKMRASYKPVQLAYFKPVFVGSSFSVRGSYSKKNGIKSRAGKGRENASAGVAVQIRKGETVTIPFAFMVPKFETPFVFARGSYQKGKGFVRATPRNPINVLSSLSPYGAAFGAGRLPGISAKARAELEEKASEYLQKLKKGIL